jgi:hypothetical protein
MILERILRKNIDFFVEMVYTVLKWSKRVVMWSKMEWR